MVFLSRLLFDNVSGSLYSLDMNNIKQLMMLGFSLTDANVYLELLRIGESSVGPLIDKTGLHREIVYGAMKHLEQQGLVQSLEKKKIKYFTITNPALIARKALEKAKMANELLPNLLEIYKKPDMVAQIYEGSDGFEELQLDILATLKDGEELLCLGLNESWYKIQKDYFKKYQKRLSDRQIQVKMMILRENLKEILQYEKLNNVLIKILPDKYKIPSAVLVYADKVATIIIAERPVVFLVNSDLVSQTYKEYFNRLWESAKDL